MEKSFELLQNQLHDITISLSRTDLIQCDHTWAGTGGRPSFSSIGLIQSGTGTIIVNGHEIQPVKDQLYLLPAHSIQTFFNDGTNPYLKYYCHFNIKLHNTELFDYIDLPLCITPQNPAEAAALFEKMIAAHKEKSLTALIRAKQYMMELVCYYLQCCQESNISMNENSFDSAINQVIHFAQEHLDTTFSVPQMAEMAGYHPSHFTKLFRKRFGVSPAQFLIQKKISAAMELLTTTVKPIAEISDSLGFSTQFYFCNVFKKQTGMTPSEYRHNYTI